MSAVEERLRELAATRDAARAALDRRIATARELAKPAQLAKRVQSEFTTRAQDISTQAVEIASDNRGILIGTGVALLGWLFRGPLLRKAKQHLPQSRCKNRQADMDDPPPS